MSSKEIKITCGKDIKFENVEIFECDIEHGKRNLYAFQGEIYISAFLNYKTVIEISKGALIKPPEQWIFIDTESTVCPAIYVYPTKKEAQQAADAMAAQYSLSNKDRYKVMKIVEED